MGPVVANMSMSLDGFIADPFDGVERLFGWYNNGAVIVPTADARWTFHTSAASADHLRDMLARVGALICGRRLFDVAKGWGGAHPTGVPVFVVTHTVPGGWPREDAPFTFLTLPTPEGVGFSGYARPSGPR
jgi:dihydrofolate reductase